tara:strand:- start:286 stop:525 length:240 start_codon:yes stop_codon:yes gene_type:complete
MSDFEISNRGTTEEIRLSRVLANEVEWVISSGGVLAVQIENAYKPLKAFYERQLETEGYEESTFPRPLQNDLFNKEIWE